MSREGPIRILVADQDARVRRALQTLLCQESAAFQIYESADLMGLARQVRRVRPRLVLLDWELPGRPAAAFLFALHRLDYQPRVIILSTRPEAEEAALDAGADAFVSKSDPPQVLLESFRRLVRESEVEYA